jgi:type 1 glutamine amidotransferase
VSKLRALLLIGGPEYHNKPFHVAELAGILVGECGADLRVTDDLSALESSADYGVVVNWSTFVQPTDDQVAALLSAVESGRTGLFGIHAATATFWNSPAYLRAIGGRFIKHDPYKQFRVDVDDASHPITSGVASFEVEDELYELGYDSAEFEELAAGVRAGRPGREMRHLAAGPLPSDIRVLASAEGHPMLYVRSHGRGRVHYNALGHDAKALTHPSVRQLFRQGLAWTAGG